ncbi:hypothetical protein, partial [Kutzneria viridogrisea]
DKLAGSAYQANKLLGGYSPSSSQATSSPAATGVDWLAVPGAAVVVAAAAGVVVARSRRTGRAAR